MSAIAAKILPQELNLTAASSRFIGDFNAAAAAIQAADAAAARQLYKTAGGQPQWAKCHDLIASSKKLATFRVGKLEVSGFESRKNFSKRRLCHVAGYLSCRQDWIGDLKTLIPTSNYKCGQMRVKWKVTCPLWMLMYMAEEKMS